MKQYLIALDQSTSATKVFLLDRLGGICRRHAEEHRQYYPRDSYVEHDAEEIWRNVQTGIRAVSEGIPPAEIAALSISNQRETVVIWDKTTGRPLCPAVVWQDVRGEPICRRLEDRADAIRERTGLPLSPYYSAAKIASVLASNSEILRALASGRACAGTMDSYLVYRLTGGQVFQTDVSNASRTQLMNLHRLAWDEEICGWFGIDPSWLPTIALSDASFGEMDGIPIAGVMGDSHAAFFSQGCLLPGTAKATYGTGSSIMMNTGEKPVASTHGLSACVAFGFRGAVQYALEGNVTCSGDTLCWLRDEAEMLDDVAQVESIAATVPNTGGVYLVPAFSGLGAPYFDSVARGTFVGLNRGTRRAHLIRAALESMAYQDADVVRAMLEDTGNKLRELRVDGGPTHNALLMQFQADLLNTPVICAAASELSALGAGYMGGMAVGFYSELDQIPKRKERGSVYLPQLPPQQRESLLAGWQRAVRQCRL